MARKKPDPRPIHAPILTADTESFGARFRTDVDRGTLRQVLQESLHEIITSAPLDGDKTAKIGDTGDGLFVLFRPELNKQLLLTSLFPKLVQRLDEHNRQSANVTRFRLRLVFHFGEVHLDEAVLTGTGAYGHALNHAFRLLDSPALREQLRRRTFTEPVALVVSDAYYTEIVTEQLPTLTKKFKRFMTETKEGAVPAWGYEFATRARSASSTSLGSPVPQARKPRKGRQPAGKVKRLTLGGLEPGCLYVSTADVHNNQLYKKLADTVPLKAQLETALLLAPRAILHCADPLRLSAVHELLQEYVSFIEGGRILFLLGSRINNLARDYPEYLTEKAAQYLISAHGTPDLTSFGRTPSLPDRVTSVIQLMSHSPIHLHRGYRGTPVFVDAVKSDLATRDRVTIDSEHTLCNIHRNLTLYQLLTLQLHSNGTTATLLAEGEAAVMDTIAQLESTIDKRSFSRQIFMDVLRTSLPRSARQNSLCFTGIETRINLLHLRINVGDTTRHAFIEITPDRDRNSPYYWEHLMNHLGPVSK